MAVPRWLRVMRGMIGTGLTFTAVVGAVGLLVGVPVWLYGEVTGVELLQVVGKCAVVAFPVGLAFSGMLAFAARRRAFEKLSVGRFAALGACAGLVYFALIGLSAYDRWSVPDALVNLVILTLMGSGAATAVLLLARRAGLARSGDALAVGDTSEADVAVENARAVEIGAAPAAAEGRLELPNRAKESVRRRD
jgi:hypothetical protein